MKGLKAMALMLKAERNEQFQILKSDDLMIGGYASIEIVDKQNDLITLKALNEAVQKGMLTLEDNKVEGVNRLVQNSIDQAFTTGTELLTNTLSSYERQMNKAATTGSKTKTKSKK